MIDLTDTLDESYEDGWKRLAALSLDELKERETMLKIQEAQRLAENLTSMTERQTINTLVRWRENPEQFAETLKSGIKCKEFQTILEEIV